MSTLQQRQRQQANIFEFFCRHFHKFQQLFFQLFDLIRQNSPRITHRIVTNITFALQPGRSAGIGGSRVHHFGPPPRGSLQLQPGTSATTSVPDFLPQLAGGPRGGGARGRPSHHLQQLDIPSIDQLLGYIPSPVGRHSSRQLSSPQFPSPAPGGGAAQRRRQRTTVARTPDLGTTYDVQSSDDQQQVRVVSSTLPSSPPTRPSLRHPPLVLHSPQQSGQLLERNVRLGDFFESIFQTLWTRHLLLRSVDETNNNCKNMLIHLLQLLSARYDYIGQVSVQGVQVFPHDMFQTMSDANKPVLEFIQEQQQQQKS